MSICFELVYGIQLDRNLVDQEAFKILEHEIYNNPKSILQLKSCGDCYQTPEKILAFRDFGWISSDLRYELPEGNQVKKISDRPLPSAEELRKAKNVFFRHQLEWKDPDWFVAVNIT